MSGVVQPEPARPFSFWPYGIMLFFLCLFAGGFLLYRTAASGPSEWLEGNPYEDGLRYQKVIEQEERFRDLRLSVAYEAGADGRLLIHLRDLNGAPVSSVSGTLYAMRPGNSKLDRRVTLSDSMNQGQGGIASGLALERGLWVLDLQISTERGVARHRTRFVSE